MRETIALTFACNYLHEIAIHGRILILVYSYFNTWTAVITYIAKDRAQSKDDEQYIDAKDA